MNVELLKALTNAMGLSGFEGPVQEIAAASLKETCDEVRRDRLGNVIGVKKARRVSGEPPLRLALLAHADEIGMMVRYIDERGYIYFDAIGGIHAPSTVSQHVIVHGVEAVHGVVAPKMDETLSTPALNDLRIDLGLPVEDVKRLVAPGDPITYAQEFVELRDGIYMGRNFDDRVGLYCLLQAMADLGETAVDVYAVSTVQEEVGVRGAVVAAAAIEAQIGLAIDGSLCQSAYSKPQEQTCSLGEGAGIYMMDRLTIGDRQVIDLLLTVAAERGIRVQRNIGGGTDASALQRTGRGAIVTTVGAPVRYMHSTVQLCAAPDLDATAALIAAFAENAHRLKVEP
ncbi:MAG TPA: M20/M25/M40 family metallo-hydrolase [Chloroflexota bacterium]|nr:M20/M25/M40 family metallo-hydrolase [Chloroflexota bacterium]